MHFFKRILQNFDFISNISFKESNFKTKSTDFFSLEKLESTLLKFVCK